MKLLTLEEIRRRLADRNLQAVARATGLAPDTVYRLANGVGTPSYATVETLSRYLEGTDGEA